MSYWKSSSKHIGFLSKTILIKDNNVEESFRALNRIISQEGIVDKVRRYKFYEKPYQQRIRLAFERCKNIYNFDMERKIKMLMTKNRNNPWMP